MTTTLATRTAPELPRPAGGRRPASSETTGRGPTGTDRAATRPTLAMQRWLIARLVG